MQPALARIPRGQWTDVRTVFNAQEEKSAMMKLLRLTPAASLVLSLLGTACYAQSYVQTNLVASQSGAGAAAVDSSLIDAWGLSRGSGSPWWVVETGKGAVKIFDGAGVANSSGLIAVSVPGGPVGTIYNGNPKAFLMALGAPAFFLFSSFDGTISGWNPNVGVAKGSKPPSTTAIVLAKGKKGSSYTGLTSAVVDGEAYLYAANYALGTVDVFSSKFKAVDFSLGSDGPTPFTDDLLPPNYVPYNVQAIGDNIVVTYAYLPSGAGFPEGGVGWGYVDVYSPRGYLKLHLDHGDWLNAPWGVALAPTDFGAFSHALLIGNFANGTGDATTFSGTIAAYDLVTGRYLGQLQDTSGKTLSIQGLWALSPGNASPANFDSDSKVNADSSAEIYFTAGPNGGKQGLFGILTAASADLTQGNDQ
jgi:uncharacterized protein (TIGR03118 family)